MRDFPKREFPYALRYIYSVQHFGDEYNVFSANPTKAPYIPRTGGAGTSTGDYYKAAGRGGLPDAESDCLNRGLCPVQIGQGNTERDISRGRRSTAKYKTASSSGNSEPVWRA